MFAVIIAGRLVQTDLNMIDETKFMFTLMDLDNVNHIVVFMTGQQAFPDGMGGAVYMNWPSKLGESGWQLVGHITNQKPSAIFKISGFQKGSTNENLFSDMSLFPSPEQPHHAQLGISLEPLTQLAQQVPATSGSSPEEGHTFADFANKMVLSFYNFASSFSTSKQEIAESVVTGHNSRPTLLDQNFIPVSVLENWLKQFQSKLSRDVNFWKK
uniref:Protein Hikeshi n=1 Tax=Ciona savignyi TaxID=51511 RepID=H2YXK0_CIOSA